MGHYDNCREGYCPSCGAAPGNIVNGVCKFCVRKTPVKKTRRSGTSANPQPPADIRHLDGAIAALSSTPGTRRARREADYVIEAMMVSGVSYVVTANGRITDSGEGSIETATVIASKRADGVRRLGTKTVKVVIHG